MSAIRTTTIDNFVELDYLAVNNYRMDINGFGGSTFAPGNKEAGPTTSFDYSQLLTEELEIYRNASDTQLRFTTVGRYSDTASGLCFFALKSTVPFQLPASPFGDPVQYQGTMDGLYLAGGVSRRLLDSKAEASADLSGTNSATITLSIQGRAPAFGEFTVGAFTPVEVVTGTATVTNGGLSGNLTGPNGLTGTFQGSIGGSNVSAMTIVFSLQRSNGDRIIGAAGLDNKLL